MKRVLLIFLFIYTSAGQKGQDLMKTLSASIGDEVLECKEKMNINEEVIHDFLEFWNEDWELQHREMGCVLDCVFERLEFFTDNRNQVNIENINGFTRAIGADDSMTNKLVELFKLCKKATSKFTQRCVASLEVTKCFRYGVFQLHWAPDIKKRGRKSRRSAQEPAIPVERPGKLLTNRQERPAQRADVDEVARPQRRGIIQSIINFLKGPTKRHKTG